MCPSSTLVEQKMTELYSAADLIGPMSFAALSFLIAALAIFRDLKADRYSLPEKYFRNLRVVVYLLSGAVALWCITIVQRVSTVLSAEISSLVATGVVYLMIALVLATTFYLAGFVTAVVRFVGTPVQSKSKLPRQ